MVLPSCYRVFGGRTRVNEDDDDAEATWVLQLGQSAADDCAARRGAEPRDDAGVDRLSTLLVAGLERRGAAAVRRWLLDWLDRVLTSADPVAQLVLKSQAVHVILDARPPDADADAQADAQTDVPCSAQPLS